MLSTEWVLWATSILRKLLILWCNVLGPTVTYQCSEKKLRQIKIRLDEIITVRSLMSCVWKQLLYFPVRLARRFGLKPFLRYLFPRLTSYSDTAFKIPGYFDICGYSERRTLTEPIPAHWWSHQSNNIALGHTVAAIFFYFFFIGWDWVHLVLHPLFGLLYQSQMIDECGEIAGVRIGRGNPSTRRKPAPMPLRPPQIPHDLIRARNRADALGSQRLTAWAMALPICRHTEVSFLWRCH
jgi:hypothetical protein